MRPLMQVIRSTQIISPQRLRTVHKQGEEYHSMPMKKLRNVNKDEDKILH